MAEFKFSNGKENIGEIRRARGGSAASAKETSRARLIVDDDRLISGKSHLSRNRELLADLGGDIPISKERK